MELRMAGKRDNIKPKFQPKKKCARRYKGNDGLSRMPDEVLVLILSCLPLKEAGRTSVLSSRWMNLWKYTWGLNFDAESELDNIVKNWRQKNFRHVERCKYINWVNSVIRSHKGLKLEEFRICFDLDKFSHKAITHWLEFAFARKVERLALELYEYGDFYRHGNKTYVFPVNFLSRMTGGTSTVQRQPRTPFDVKALKELCLKSVDVTDEAIEFFLCNCPLLEQLIIHDSSKLLGPFVFGSSLMLKHLEILNCFELGLLMISAPNLTSLKLTSISGLLLFKVPMLVDVSICSSIDEHFEKKFVPTVLGIHQLEILTLRLHSLMDINKPWIFPHLPKLTKLEIIYLAEGDESLIGLTFFLNPSPNLQEFVFRMEWSRNLSRTKREIKSYGGFLYQGDHLKVIKFLGYYGRASDIEFIESVLEGCPVLEKIVIDPHLPWPFPRFPLYPDEVEAERAARISAKLLSEAGLSSRVEFVIL